MVPTTFTPAASRSSSTTASVETMTTAIGPAFAVRSAARGAMPNVMSSGFRPLRTQNRKAVAVTPIISVGKLVLPTFCVSVCSSSGIASPLALMPRIDFIWLVAMMMPDAVIKPEITGCDKRLARKPSRSTPINSNISPDRSASTSAAAMNSALPGAAMLLAAVSVISEMTATGPTASARLVPNRA
jgi:hypothetical protein